jgi:hypothetical protein
VQDSTYSNTENFSTLGTATASNKCLLSLLSRLQSYMSTFSVHALKGCNLLLIVFLYFYIWRLYWCTHVNNWCPFMYICVSNCAGCIFRRQESQSMAQIQNNSLYCTQTEVCMAGQQQVVEHTKIWSTYHTVKHLQTSNRHISHLTLVNDWWGLQDIIQTFKKCKW